MVLKYLVLQNLRNVAALQEETEKPITNCYTRVIEAFGTKSIIVHWND